MGFEIAKTVPELAHFDSPPLAQSFLCSDFAISVLDLAYCGSSPFLRAEKRIAGIARAPVGSPLWAETFRDVDPEVFSLPVIDSVSVGSSLSLHSTAQMESVLLVSDFASPEFFPASHGVA
eukprot:s2617_g3.t1